MQTPLSPSISQTGVIIVMYLRHSHVEGSLLWLIVVDIYGQDQAALAL